MFSLNNEKRNVSVLLRTRHNVYLIKPRACSFIGLYDMVKGFKHVTSTAELVGPKLNVDILLIFNIFWLIFPLKHSAQIVDPLSVFTIMKPILGKINVYGRRFKRHKSCLV